MGDVLEATSLGPDDVREQVRRIVASGEFRTSERNRSFLRYVTEETLAGRADQLKAYSIACNVFGRPESFDPVGDPIVRIEAGKLRSALQLYYLTAGASDPVRIDIPKGGYVPIFRRGTTIGEARPRTGEREAPRVAVLPFNLLSCHSTF